MRTVFLLLALCIKVMCFAQNKTYHYYFDNKLSFTQKENATIIGEGKMLGDILRVNFVTTGDKKPLFTIDFTDTTLSVIHGQDTRYHPNGKKSVTSNINNNKLDGATLKWNTDGLLTDSIIYKNDAIVFEAWYGYAKDILVNQVFKDSINNTLHDVWFAPDGNISSEAFFTGEKGVVKQYKDGTLISTDSVYSRQQTNSSFIGGQKAWRSYLEYNLNMRDVVNRKPPGGAYTVMVQFIIEKDGSLSDIKALSNHGYGMEDEAVRVIKYSKKWIPATKYGLPVKSYKKQPIIFSIQEDISPISSMPPHRAGF